MNVKPITSINGVITPPGDKSVTHRAVMLNAMAEGRATIKNALLGEDCRSTIRCMRALGAEIETDGTTVSVIGTKKLKSGQKLDVGNSGTTLRLLTGLLSGRRITAELDGDESIRKRPMGRVIDPLTLMGARISSNDGKTPVKIKSASLKGIRYEMPVASAQIKSAILFAGLSASGETVVVEPAACRNHSEIMLSAMSADIAVKGNEIRVRPSVLKSVDVNVPNDISSAAYPMVLATCLEGSGIVLKNIGINPTRRAVIDIINAHGGRITKLNARTTSGERVADLLVESAVLRPFDLGGEVIPNIIDEIPVLAVMAAMTRGDSVIRDAQELKVKESNRIVTTVNALRAMGVSAEATEDGMIIHGSGVIMGGAVIDPHMDHRIAMSMAVAAAMSAEGAEIMDDEVVNVSYPGFYTDVIKQG